jgi:hypothetical protein
MTADLRMAIQPAGEQRRTSPLIPEYYEQCWTPVSPYRRTGISATSQNPTSSLCFMWWSC